MARGATLTAAQLDAFVDALSRGAKEKEAAAHVGRSLGTFEGRRKNDPEFDERCERAIGRADAEVVFAAFQAAIKTDRHGRYDTRAQQLWLTNRLPEQFRDRRYDDPGAGLETPDAPRVKWTDLTPEQRGALTEARQIAHQLIKGALVSEPEPEPAKGSTH